MSKKYYELTDILNAIDSVRCDDCSNDESKRCAVCQIDTVKDAILEKPNTIIEEGNWLYKKWSTEDDWGYMNHRSIECSICGQEFYNGEPSDYCPRCGAQMNGVINK